MRIDDGLGSGRQAEVSETFRLKVDASNMPLMAVRSEEGGAFIYSTNFRSPNTTSEVGLFLITGQAAMTHMNYVRLCSTAQARWRLYKNITSQTGTTFTTENAVNANFGSGAVFRGTTQRWSAGTSIAITGGEMVGCFVTGTYSGAQFSIDDSLIMTPTNSLLITVQPVAASATETFSVSAAFFEHV